MKTSYKNWFIDKDEQHIITVTLDKTNTSTNVLSHEVLTELQLILEEVKKSSTQALIFASGKNNSFIAGADVSEFSQLKSYEQALTAIQFGQHVMNTIENLPFPTIALINGFCLGGGMELALACDYRIALDHEQTKLGLPEVKLGIHPGFGGTVRANRLLGVFKSMNLMLSGRVISARSARKIGLIDDVVPERHFRKSALQWLASRTKHNSKGLTQTSMVHNTVHNTVQKKRPFYYSLLELDLIRPIVAYILYKNVSKRVQKKHYPAPFELINLWQQYANDDDFMMKKEAESVASLITGETAQNLIRVFGLQNQLKSLTHVSSELTQNTAREKTRPLQHIHIIGGGVMGGDIAIWCAYKGFTVTVHDKSNEILARLIHRADKFLQKKIKDKRLIQAVMDRLIPDINNFGIKKAELVIEAIIEDVNAKQHVFKAAEISARPECIFATNTSSIPLDDISQSLDNPSRLVGIHFFNPVAKMPLIEVVSSTKTSAAAKQMAYTFSGKIGKLPLPVTSTPGFLVNRVLMPYLLEAIELYSEGIPAAYIDKAATEFGMPMGPIELADKVGLDICLSVARNLAQSRDVTVPKILTDKVSNGLLGLKSGGGFYAYKKGKPVRSETTYQGLSLKQVTDRLMFRLFNEAVACLDEKVVENPDYLDAGIIFGTGFAPFLGGPMHYIQHRGITEMDHTLVDLSRDYGERFKPTIGWEHLTV